jgi:hypothetical protein
VFRRKDRDQLTEMTEPDQQRLIRIFDGIARATHGRSIDWTAEAYLDAWIVEHRMQAERRATWRLTVATWALVFATVVLAGATIAVVFATAATHP